MGYDIYIVRQGEGEKEFHERDEHSDDEYFRASLAGMPTLINAMGAAGIFKRLDPLRFMFNECEHITAEESGFIATSLRAGPLAENPDDARFIEKFRKFCERAAAGGGFRIC